MNTLASVVALVRVLSVVVIFASSCSRPVFVPEPESAKRTVQVKAVSLVQEEVAKTTTQPATVLPYYRAEIRAKASGYVNVVKADLGDVVKAGDVLATIDVPEMDNQKQILLAKIERAKSQETRAQAGVELASADVESAEAKLAQAKSEMSSAEASLAAADAEFTRTQDLVQRQSLEGRVLDEVRKQRDSQLAKKQAMESAITSAEASVTVAKARKTAAEADRKVAQTETTIAERQLEELETLMAYATLKAPFAGLVTVRHLDPGDLVDEGPGSANGDPLFVVSQVDKVRVQIPVPEVDAAWVSAGDSVSLSFPSFPLEETIEASITRVAGELDPATRTMLVEAELDNSDRKLLPGMFGRATISLNNKVAANMLPARAIRFDEAGNPYVYLIGSDEKVSVVSIQTGVDTGPQIEVVSGLEPGQRVVDAHLDRFTDGQSVAVLSDGSKAESN
ncbi:MAG: efflux RND transporter periplasmic adaptor subunit [Planctomycetaceae bacterium]|nr:efflux RND transporter periplasmic adaptor subunit [Planctomycetaceae bacterium]